MFRTLEKSISPKRSFVNTPFKASITTRLEFRGAPDPLDIN